MNCLIHFGEMKEEKNQSERQKNDLNKNKKYKYKSILSPIEGQTLTNETTNDILNEDNEQKISNETKSKITASYIENNRKTDLKEL
ncbi:MAG: hypothetical protein CM15mP114_08020 [Alphaproteobacteria bacterium]|nr:MAG: hypothetical protein CM15mP114_08020 [Alphaproteobacteria bacterium]